MIKHLDQSVLKQWIEDSLSNNTNILAAGYQGKTLLYQNDGLNVVIKTPHGQGLAKYLHSHMLRHEAQAYQQLKNLKGTPACYGLIDNKYLALEFIDGDPIRSKRPIDEKKYFQKLFIIIEQMHDQGVAHMDLKKKDNLMVTHHDEPCMLDFGVAVIQKKGFHPVNHFLFNLARRFDYNAWVKHKYHNNMHNIEDADKIYYQRTLIEKTAKKIKRTFKL
ncbi:MAG: hypothetical protein OQK32_07895 [Gammaproteobacteria bacterium]|nr:hypothetical protein [Gammaproteobacteria bacterium]MCW8922295.1 hypothetical protein [Gammaproteobacteria bacterium]